MNISQKHDIALQFLTSMRHGRTSIQAAAKETGISTSYLEQIASRLRKAGLIVSVRGPGGGYNLARPLEGIMLVDVLNGIGMSGHQGSSLLFPAILDRLKGTSIAELLPEIA